jgi:hypothetical protein
LNKRAIAVVLLVLAGLVNVDIVQPRINIRWADGLDADERRSLERRFTLEAGEPTEGTTWRYELHDQSRDNIRALIDHPAVVDTHDLDQAALTAPDRSVRVTVRGWNLLVRAGRSGLFQVQSLVLILCGSVLLWAATLASSRWRRGTAAAVLLVAAAMAFVVPLRQPITMGDSETYTATRRGFEQYSGVHQIRTEAHLSHAILGRLDAWYGRTADSPVRALRVLTRAATVFFFVAAFGVGLLERWSPLALRYLGLALIAPSTLLYFGYQELGYLSLNMAAFPLLARGLRTGGRALETSGLLSGIGAALHGFGLLSLAGAGLAALGRPVPLLERLRGGVRLGASGMLAYLVWIPIYVLVLRLPITSGHAGSIPLRPWLADVIQEGRVNVAAFSTAGARDLAFTAWVAGVPLVALAACLWRRYPDEVRAAALYTVPSIVFLTVFWPVQGLAIEMDLVLAAFPALYALTWVCAHDTRTSMVAAVVLASAHIAFWRVVMGDDFVNLRLH